MSRMIAKIDALAATQLCYICCSCMQRTSFLRHCRHFYECSSWAGAAIAAMKSEPLSIWPTKKERGTIASWSCPIDVRVQFPWWCPYVMDQWSNPLKRRVISISQLRKMTRIFQVNCSYMKSTRCYKGSFVPNHSLSWWLDWRENERELSLGLAEVSMAILTKSLRDNATTIKTEHKRTRTKCEHIVNAICESF